jgi:hypothetical protein
MRKLLLLAVAVSLIYGFVYEKSISIPLNRKASDLPGPSKNPNMLSPSILFDTMVPK